MLSAKSVRFTRFLRENAVENSLFFTAGRSRALESSGEMECGIFNFPLFPKKQFQAIWPLVYYKIAGNKPGFVPVDPREKIRA